MAELRGVFNRMADSADIENALEVALEEFVQPMMAEHPYMTVDTPYRPELQISVTIYRPGRARINAGDWVEYRGGDDRLTKQIGAEAALGHVVEADYFSPPRITWLQHEVGEAYALFDEEADNDGFFLISIRGSERDNLALEEVTRFLFEFNLLYEVSASC